METTLAIPASAQAFVERLSAEPGVSRVVLFGSRARGDHRARSDVDLAVEAPGLSPSDWRRLRADAEGARTLYRIDLVDLDRAPERLRERIRAEGVDV